MSRRSKVTDADLDQLADDILFFGAQTEQVLAERIAHPRVGEVVEIPVDRLDADPEQPRKQFSEATLRELSQTIGAHGVLQPIIVRAGTDDRYLIVAGERRFRAARMAGLGTVPCILRDYSEQDAAIIALVENVHRDDLTDIEISDALWELKQRTGQTWEDLAGMIRLGVPRVKQLAGLQALAEPVKEQVRAGVLSGRKALALRPLPPQEQILLAQEAATRSLTAEQIRQWAEQRGVSPKSRPRKSQPQAPSITRYTASPDPLTPLPEGIPGIVAECRRAIRATLVLLRHTGADEFERAYADEFLQELRELEAILQGRSDEV